MYEAPQMMFVRTPWLLLCFAAVVSGLKVGAGDVTTLDLNRCARAYPFFLTHLERHFGQRFANPADLAKDPWYQNVIFALELSPDDPTTVVWSLERAGTGDAFKRAALAKLMRGVVQKYGSMLRPEVEAVGGRVRFFWRFMNGDSAQQRKTHLGLPVHGWSSDSRHDDMAMPDFTFENYPSINSQGVNPEWVSDSWRDVAGRLREVKHTKRGFIWRGDLSSELRRKVVDKVAAGPPASLQPLLREAAPDGFDVKLISWGDHGGVRGTGDGGYISLYDQCKWAYTFHLQGRHYSAMLKYKLACNQTVFMVENHGEEFWYDALKDKENIFFIKSDLSNFWEVIGDALGPVQVGPGKPALPAGARAKEVAEKGLETADAYLSQDGIDCYVMEYLLNYYIPLYKRAFQLNSSHVQMKFRSFETI